MIMPCGYIVGISITILLQYNNETIIPISSVIQFKIVLLIILKLVYTIYIYIYTLPYII